ncbi:hypothetical protein IDH50_01185 [Aeromicrobium tamlense]|jgi:hypothetical protein|uniref:Uncharacterized protein n=1 Tax=Aeromicrobium tamlense TaxID=375541 RepID=A0A8I0KHK4_9ACTN|nr:MULTISPECIES: hypothetical protein [Aeromicrobium]MBD1268837.1 hypothetical protein [Aeromicrobium tamlense]NYI37256.1 hypothetical protein [Aeromicrobium tamlense]
MLDLMLAAEEVAEHGEAAINHWVVGGIALGVLMLLLLITFLFGLGREHT